jgi:uncharacterized membrane protein
MIQSDLILCGLLQFGWFNFIQILIIFFVTRLIKTTKDKKKRKRETIPVKKKVPIALFQRISKRMDKVYISICFVVNGHLYFYN